MFEVQSYHCHPDFTNPMKGNDILLLKVTARPQRPCGPVCPNSLRAGLSCDTGAGGDSLQHTTFTDKILISIFSVPLSS